jgi:hypothetical protein
MPADEYYTSGRHHRNERSRDNARNTGKPWGAYDEQYLARHWIDVPCEDRKEWEVARHLGRTIEACRVRAEIIRGVRPQNGGGERNKDAISRQTAKPYIAHDDDDPLQQWYA